MQNTAVEALLPSLSSTFPITVVETPAEENPASRRRSRLLNHRGGAATADTTLKQNRNAAALSARQEIRTNIREDWEWQGIGSAQTSPYTRVEADTEWRERDSDSSSESSSPKTSTISSPYKYETPDSIAEAIVTRKRKRRRLQLVEMSWNDGLNTYIHRRDAWTGGLTLPRTSSTEFPRSASGNLILPPEHIKPTSYDPHHLSKSPETVPPTDLIELTPLPPPLIPPTNLMRASITQLHYPAIYRKVVAEGGSPAIPINLADLTRALVQGWKVDGEWPPKATAIEAPIGKKKKVGFEGILDGRGEEKGPKVGLATRGVGRMKRVLGIIRTETEKEEGSSLNSPAKW